MPRASDGEPVPFPIRGTPGGWRDPWEEDEAAAARAELAERERRLFGAGGGDGGGRQLGPALRMVPLSSA